MSSPVKYWPKSIKFILVGAVNTVATYALYVILVNAGLQYAVALTLDYLVGILSGYLMNRHWTFVSHDSTHRSLVKYITTYVLVYLINLILLSLIVGLKILDPVFGQVLALGVVTMISFLLQNFWVFQRQSTVLKHKSS